MADQGATWWVPMTYPTIRQSFSQIVPQTAEQLARTAPCYRLALFIYIYIDILFDINIFNHSLVEVYTVHARRCTSLGFHLSMIYLVLSDLFGANVNPNVDSIGRLVIWDQRARKEGRTEAILLL